MVKMLALSTLLRTRSDEFNEQHVTGCPHMLLHMLEANNYGRIIRGGGGGKSSY